MSFDVALDTPRTTPFDVPALLRRKQADTVAALEQHDRHSPRRAELESFVRAVVGCRAAATEPLFLETYTRMPIEAALLEHHGALVARERIVEIGSLACRNATAAIAIVRALVPHLLRAGFTWVVFTGADTVMNVFRYLELAPRALCPADPLLLGDARHEWGTYYDHHPYVMAGRIEDGYRAVAPALARGA